MATVVKTLKRVAHDGAYVRVLRTWSDKKDRIKPEIYRFTEGLSSGAAVLENLLTGVKVQNVAQDPRVTYLIMTHREASDYLNECFERALRDSEFLSQMGKELTEKKDQLQRAIKKLY